ncbi:MAG: hypothetical protein QM504_18175 [Pseudomonadota bacterium]
MKKIFLKIFELLPFFSIIFILGFLIYWQFAQYKKIEDLESHLENYYHQINTLISHQKQVQQKLVQQQISYNNAFKRDIEMIKKSIDEVVTHKKQNSKIEQTTNSYIVPLKSLQSITKKIPSEELVIKPEVKIIEHKNLLIENNLPVSSQKLSQSSSDVGLEIEQILKQCKVHLNAYRLTSGASGNAYDCYLSIFEKDEINEQAFLGMEAIEKKYQETIIKYIKLRNFSKAQKFLSILKRINPINKSILPLQQQLEKSQKSVKNTTE